MVSPLCGLIHNSQSMMEENFVILSTEFSRQLWLINIPENKKEREWRSVEFCVAVPGSGTFHFISFLILESLTNDQSWL